MPHTDEIQRYEEHKRRGVNRNELGPIAWAVLAMLAAIACVLLVLLLMAGCEIPPAMIVAMILAAVCIVPALRRKK